MLKINYLPVCRGNVEFKKNKFEQKVLADVYKKDPDMIGESIEELLEEINYDNFTPIAVYAKGLSMPSSVMPMVFNTMRTILGENPNIADFKILPNGNLKQTQNVSYNEYFEINLDELKII